MNSDVELDEPDEMAPCPRCGKRIDINHTNCPNCGYRFKISGMSPWLNAGLIVGLIVGIPVLIAIAGILLLFAICALG